MLAVQIPEEFTVWVCYVTLTLTVTSHLTLTCVNTYSPTMITCGMPSIKMTRRGHPSYKAVSPRRRKEDMRLVQEDLATLFPLRMGHLKLHLHLFRLRFHRDGFWCLQNTGNGSTLSSDQSYVPRTTRNTAGEPEKDRHHDQYYSHP